MERGIELAGHAVQYYTLSRQWKSDLKFFRIEAAFFHRLLDDYFVRLLAPSHIEQLKQTGENLYKLEKDENYLTKLVDHQLTRLDLIAKVIIPEDKIMLAAKHSQLEQLMTSLVAEYRSVKKQLFELLEKIMNENKLISE